MLARQTEAYTGSLPSRRPMRTLGKDFGTGLEPNERRRMIAIHTIEEHNPAFAAARALVPHALLWVFQRIARCFRVTSDDAPGLSIVGGELALSPAEATAHDSATMSATGTGLVLAEALTAFLGEAAELLSQFERPGDVSVRRRRADIESGDNVCAGGWIGAALSTVPAAAPLDWTTALCTPDARAVLVPSDVCVRREPQHRRLEPAGALSSGCAAGASLAAAKERAILELIERDAAALWWYGGRPPRHAGARIQAAGDALLATLRQGCARRRTTFLDIATDLGIPVMAAISVDPDGRGLACGLGARLDPAEALSAAIRELCQMELSAPLAAMKREVRGEAALNASDRRHLRRAAFDAGSCPLLAPSGGEPGNAALPPATLRELLTRLQSHGIRLFTVDLTRDDIGVPVMRALSPELQPFVPAALTQRLISAIKTYGGGSQHTIGTPLI